jgi:hypothetical protein
MATNVYNNARQSLFKYCQELALSLNASEGYNLTVINFDAHADLNSLPAQDIIGVADFSLTSDDGLLILSASIRVGTEGDADIARLENIINVIFDQLQPANSLDLVDFDSSAKIGNLKIMNGTTVYPVMKTKTRPLKSVGISLASDLTSS